MMNDHTTNTLKRILGIVVNHNETEKDQYQIQIQQHRKQKPKWKLINENFINDDDDVDYLDIDLVEEENIDDDGGGDTIVANTLSSSPLSLQMIPTFAP